MMLMGLAEGLHAIGEKQGNEEMRDLARELIVGICRAERVAKLLESHPVVWDADKMKTERQDSSAIDTSAKSLIHRTLYNPSRGLGSCKLVVDDIVIEAQCSSGVAVTLMNFPQWEVFNREGEDIYVATPYMEEHGGTKLSEMRVENLNKMSGLIFQGKYDIEEVRKETITSSVVFVQKGSSLSVSASFRNYFHGSVVIGNKVFDIDPEKKFPVLLTPTDPWDPKFDWAWNTSTNAFCSGTDTKGNPRGYLGVARYQETSVHPKWGMTQGICVPEPGTSVNVIEKDSDLEKTWDSYFKRQTKGTNPGSTWNKGTLIAANGQLRQA